MLEYSILTRHEAERWQETHARDAGDPLSDMHLDDLARYAPDETVAILATDGGRIVGRILLAHSDVLVDGTPRRFLVGRNLLVREEYRRHAVGIQLLARVMRLGKPYIAASVSAEMGRIFDAWRNFHRVDATPVYALGLDRYGVARTTRLALQQLHAAGKRVALLDTVRGVLARAWRALGTLIMVPGGFARLPADEAEAALESIARTRRFRVQIPWHRDTVVAALRRGTGNCRAAVFRDRRSSCAPARLLTLYFRTIEGGVYSVRDVRQLRVAYLNEVFPPLDDDRTARYAVGLAAREARSAGAGILFVCAATPALERACAGLDLAMRRSIYVTPAGLDPAAATAVVEPGNWWCRAVNENQFEESYAPDGLMGALT